MFSLKICFFLKKTLNIKTRLPSVELPLAVLEGDAELQSPVPVLEAADVVGALAKVADVSANDLIYTNR